MTVDVGAPGVHYTCAEGVAVITIDRPQSRNAIGLATIGELEEALEAVASSPDAAVLVLRGAGDRAFVSGGDLRELSSIRTESAAIDMALRMRRLLDAVTSFPLPVIAALNGHALGGGAEVAIAADIRVMADDARIGFTQAALGIMPAWGGAERLAEVVGRGRAILLISSARQLSAVEARDLGLADFVLPRHEFELGWRKIASEIANLGPRASTSIKKVVSGAKPHVHPLLEVAAATAFAELWVDERHWTLAESVLGTRPDTSPEV